MTIRQQIATFASLMERKLDDEPETMKRDALVAEMDKKLVLLKATISPCGEIDAATAAFDAVDIANLAMRLVQVVTRGKLSTVPPNLSKLNAARPYGGDKEKVTWFRWSVMCTGRDADPVMYTGRTFAASDDGAMVSVRKAAIDDKVPRPFQVVIARVYGVADETVQRTNDMTEAGVY